MKLISELYYGETKVAETLQDAFDRVVWTMHRQDGPSVAEGKVTYKCRYRGAGKRVCAAGVFIPDALYDDEYEGNGVRRLPFTARVNADHPSAPVSASEREQLEEDERLEWLMVLEAMQNAHDNAADLNDEKFFWSFSERMVAIARRHKLNPAAVFYVMGLREVPFEVVNSDWQACYPKADYRAA